MLKLDFFFVLAVEIIQVLDPIAWVRCASGNVSLGFPYYDRGNLSSDIPCFTLTKSKLVNTGHCTHLAEVTVEGEPLKVFFNWPH